MKNLTQIKKCKTCKNTFCKPRTVSRKSWTLTRYCSKRCYYDSKELRNKTIKSNKSRIWTIEARIKVSNSQKGKHNSTKTEFKKGQLSGSKHPLWKGGTTPLNILLRQTLEYKNWRLTVFRRDFFTCQHCGYKGSELHADHIKSWVEYPKLRYEISNGRTLCVGCHYRVTFKKTMPQNIVWGHHKRGGVNL